MTPTSRDNRGRAWAALTASGTVLLLAVALATYTNYNAWRRESERAKYVDVAIKHLKYVWIMLENYDDTYGHLPPRIIRNAEGQEFHSWRSAILHFGGSYPGRRPPPDLTVSWRSPENQQWAMESEYSYCWRSSDRPLETAVTAVSGAGAPWNIDPMVRLSDLPSHTILLVSIAHSGFHWMEPGDVDIAAVDEALRVESDELGILVVFADGEVWQLNPTVPSSHLKPFFTTDGARKLDRETMLGRFRLRRWQQL